MDEPAPHPLYIARTALGLTRVAFAEKIQEAARRRSLRSGTDKQRVRK
ncbi:hypothetical protein [Streptomyces abyssomicinicus]|nr:hypothetical protein [Streptomyces abyssomicinicus]